MAGERHQRSEPIAREDVYSVELPRQQFRGCIEDDLLCLWLRKIVVDAGVLAYKDAPVSLLGEFNKKLESHISTMLTFSANDAKNAEELIKGRLSELFVRVCDLSAEARIHKAIGPALRFLEEYEAAAYISSLVEFEIRELAHPDDTVPGCSHMASAMYQLCGHEPAISVDVRLQRRLYAFHLRLHMYCRAPWSQRQVWLGRLCESAGTVWPLLATCGRIDDALFFYKVDNAITWASGEWDTAAKKSMMALSRSFPAERWDEPSVITSSIYNGKVVRADYIVKMKCSTGPLKQCGSCGVEEKRPHDFQSCACRMVAYCCRGCQKQHWKLHKATCTVTAHTKTPIVRDDALE